MHRAPMHRAPMLVQCFGIMNRDGFARRVGLDIRQEKFLSTATECAAPRIPQTFRFCGSEAGTRECYLSVIRAVVGTASTSNTGGSPIRTSISRLRSDRPSATRSLDQHPRRLSVSFLLSTTLAQVRTPERTSALVQHHTSGGRFTEYSSLPACRIQPESA